MNVVKLSPMIRDNEDARHLPTSEAMISARLERLPWSRWHTTLVAVVGTAHFFDSFDALTLAFVLPVLTAQWTLNPIQAGLLIAVGYVGQTVGSVVFGLAAERIGRRRALRYALAVLSVMSLCSAYASGFAMLMTFRLLQGIGLGGESPAAAAYINEICPARVRGRAIYTLQTIFSAGIVVASFAALWLIPLFGWPSMYFVGAAPLLLAIFLPHLVPESPRWLASVGRRQEASDILHQVEQAVERRDGILGVPTVGIRIVSSDPVRLAALFKPEYVARTLSVWIIAFCTAITGYGLASWMPSLFVSVYHLPLATALHHGLVISVAGMLGVGCGIFLIDWIGRKPVFVFGFAGAAVLLLLLWQRDIHAPPSTILILATLSMLFISLILSGIHAYIPELYPTRMRGAGTGAALAWYRMGSMVGPVIVGALLSHLGVFYVFLLFSTSAFLGALTMFLFGVETKGRVLEDIAI